MGDRKKPGFGKQLAELHRWNAWLVVVLAASGLLLSWGAARGWLGEGRVWLKQLHIYIGLITAIVLALYGPMMKRHLKQLRTRPRQRGNLVFVLALLVGWLLSGIVLWQFRHLPPRWANIALVVHDLLTWIGLPYIAYHSATRLRWMRKPEKRAVRTGGEAGAVGAAAPAALPRAGVAVGAAQAEEGSGLRWREADEGTPRGSAAGRAAPRPVPAEPQAWMSRRQFIRWSVGIAIAASVAPPFLRWMGGTLRDLGPSASGGMSADTDPNRMLPAPEPLPDSASVVGGGAQGRFRVYTVTPLPKFDSASWAFTIDGLVEQPGKWNWEDFLQLKRTVQVSDFHCVTGWSVYNNTWEGIPLAQLLAAAGVKSKAKYVKFYSGDGEYTDALSLEQAMMEGVLVALLHDGKPIHRDYGGPVRLIVPKMYAYKSVKWLERIELIEEPHFGYWEVRGYDNDAWV
ncbi:molybdopterin-dependent oxidoreductase [Cohnella fermenti]|uniref:Oxidoreductase n=1 Tax=Cohnella fermenti TaxID=2565925 RepID=A0A4V3WGF9_9BACL|nr:molybdopterin-dependent oxidoreductase [Cohnella fermenti]THF84089.1 oxidoreductase [Cohnella fermenti]